ncbi:MAG TPA: universal stress protein [Aggregicoccus sp.]|nr:universal stress protein [Aggregicoccus sp.]
MSILCTTNLSPLSSQVAQFAAQLARRREQPLWLVHPALGRDALLGDTPELRRQLSEEAVRLEAQGTEVHAALVPGGLRGGLLPFVSARRATLLIVASPPLDRPFTPPDALAQLLARSAPQPVLVVRDPTAFSGWARGRGALRVMLGLDRSRPCEAASAWLQELARWGPLEVVATHVYWPPDERRRLGLPRPAWLDEPDEAELAALEALLRRELEQRLAPLRRVAQVRLRLWRAPGRIADPLVEAAVQEKVDLLVVGTHHRRALGRLRSVSQTALELAPMAVACVPASSVPPLQRAPAPEYRAVLLATDFSELANGALPHALAVLQPGGTLHLLHVTATSLGAREERVLRRRLVRLALPQARARGLHVQAHVRTSSDPAACICQAAERHDVQLICLGSSGRAGLPRLVLGSVAQQVLNHSRRPLLLVRLPEEG